jgi:hypothetical protein
MLGAKSTDLNEGDPASRNIYDIVPGYGQLTSESSAIWSASKNQNKGDNS